MEGPQFSKYPSSSTPRAPRGVGGGIGTGVGGGRGAGTGVGGTGPGDGTGEGAGVGAGVAGQSPVPEHDFDQSVEHNPLDPPEG